MRVGLAQDTVLLLSAFWLLTGRNVFQAQSAVQMLAKHLHEPPVSPSTLAEEDVPPDLDRILLDCLEKDPGRRVTSADELDQRLAALQRSVPWPADAARRWWDVQRPPRSDAEETRGVLRRASEHARV